MFVLKPTKPPRTINYFPQRMCYDTAARARIGIEVNVGLKTGLTGVVIATIRRRKT